MNFMSLPVSVLFTLRQFLYKQGSLKLCRFFTLHSFCLEKLSGLSEAQYLSQPRLICTVWTVFSLINEICAIFVMRRFFSSLLQFWCRAVCLCVSVLTDQYWTEFNPTHMWSIFNASYLISLIFLFLMYFLN